MVVQCPRRTLQCGTILNQEEDWELNASWFAKQCQICRADLSNIRLSNRQTLKLLNALATVTTVIDPKDTIPHCYRGSWEPNPNSNVKHYACTEGNYFFADTYAYSELTVVFMKAISSELETLKIFPDMEVLTVKKWQMGEFPSVNYPKLQKIFIGSLRYHKGKDIIFWFKELAPNLQVGKYIQH